MVRVRMAMIAIVVLSMVLAACGGGGSVTVADAWVRAAPAGAMTAGYFKIDNRTDTEVTLVAASSDQLGLIEIHETRPLDPDAGEHEDAHDHDAHDHDGHDHGDHGDEHVMTMVKIDSVTVPAGETVVFEPGGLHLMIFDLPEDLNEGETVSIDLKFADGATITVQAEVR